MRADDYTFREKVTESWRDALNWTSAKFPRHILLRRDDGVVTMTLDSCRLMGLPDGPAAALETGRQSSAFDVYAAALRAYSIPPSDTVRLTILEDALPPVDTSLYTTYVHYGRFLYRCMRFAEAHQDWFFIAEPLATHVNAFRDWFRSTRFRTDMSLKRKGRPSPAEQLAERFVTEWQEFMRTRESYTMAQPSGTTMPLGLRIEEPGTPEGKDLFADRIWGPSFWYQGRASLAVYLIGAGGRKLGVLSELFLMANLARDIYWQRLPNIRLDPSLPADSPLRWMLPDLAWQSWTSMRTAVIVPHGTMHPLLDSAVLRQYNRTATDERRIFYRVLDYEIVTRPDGRQMPKILQSKHWF